MEISIIIPTYNRLEQLKMSLESLTKLESYTKDFEVIIVDDGSKISLDNLINNFSNQLNLKLITQQNAGPATARNTGAKQAQGKFLAFLDDDCFLPSDWLINVSQILTKYCDNLEILIGGKTVNFLNKNIYATASQMLIDYLYSVYNYKHNKANFFTSNNMIISKQLFFKVGGFNVDFPLAAGEDREFCYRLSQQGYFMIYAENIIVYHAHNLSLSTFWQQNVNYGKGAYYFQANINKLEEQTIETKGNNFQPISFYWDLITYPLTNKSEHNLILLIILFILSQLAVTLGYFNQKSSF